LGPVFKGGALDAWHGAPSYRWEVPPAPDAARGRTPPLKTDPRSGGDHGRSQRLVATAREFFSALIVRSTSFLRL
ncbi:hypothetical protein SPAR_31291, partial [Streptomyces sparsogenes DSM 40356]